MADRCEGKLGLFGRARRVSGIGSRGSGEESLDFGSVAMELSLIKLGLFGKKTASRALDQGQSRGTVLC